MRLCRVVHFNSLLVEVIVITFYLHDIGRIVNLINLLYPVTLSRNTFFLLLLLVCISPTIIWKLVWLSRTTVTNGKVWFIGHTLEINGSISKHLVVLFKVGNDSISFNAPANLPFKEDDPVPVRYVPDEPSTASVDIPMKFLGDALLYGLWPLSVLAVIYFMPDSLDPVVPRKSKIRLSRKKIIEIIRE